MATGESPVREILHKESRVHFSDDQVQQHDSEIVIEKGSSESELHIHLGFLQLSHRYEIKFKIRDSLGEAVTWSSSGAEYAMLVEAKPYAGAEGHEGHELLLNFRSNKEKLITEEFILTNYKKDEHLTLTLHARILGKDKGTPVLREGIHCIEKDEANDVESLRCEFPVRDGTFKLE